MQTNKKCKGCGSILTTEKNCIGYVPKINKDTKLCYRCFRLKHYNEKIEYTNTHEIVNETFEQLELKDKYVFVVVDVLDLINSLIDIKQETKKIILLVNKMDVFNKNTNLHRVQENIINNLKSINYKYDEIIFCSSNSLSSIKRINDTFKKIPKNAKCIFIGKTNVGKSSIMNKLLELNGLDANLSINNSLNTTINLQKIKMNYHFIIDTPGLNEKSSLLNYIDNSSIMTSSKIVRPKTFQVKHDKNITLENIISFDVYNTNTNGSITFYCNDQLKFMTRKINDDKSNLFNQSSSISYIDSKQKIKELKFDFNDDERANIVISGLGLIVIKNVKSISIFINDQIKVDKLKYNIL